MNTTSKRSLNGKWILLTAFLVILISGAFYLWSNGSTASVAGTEEPVEVRAGLIAHWALDEGLGATTADVVSSYEGMLHGEPTWAEGKNGRALLFDGQDDEVALTPLNLDDGTIAAWVHWNTKSILMAGTSYEEGYWLFFDEEYGSVNINWGGQFRRFRDVFETGVWTHVSMTRRDSVLSLYKDGVLQEMNEFGSSNTATIRSIGALYAGDGTYQRFDGIIDDLRIYDRALSASEIETLYAAQNR